MFAGGSTYSLFGVGPTTGLQGNQEGSYLAFHLRVSVSNVREESRFENTLRAQPRPLGSLGSRVSIVRARRHSVSIHGTILATFTIFERSRISRTYSRFSLGPMSLGTWVCAENYDHSVSRFVIKLLAILNFGYPPVDHPLRTCSLFNVDPTQAHLVSNRLYSACSETVSLYSPSSPRVLFSNVREEIHFAPTLRSG